MGPGRFSALRVKPVVLLAQSVSFRSVSKDKVRCEHVKSSQVASRVCGIGEWMLGFRICCLFFSRVIPGGAMGDWSIRMYVGTSDYFQHRDGVQN